MSHYIKIAIKWRGDRFPQQETLFYKRRINSVEHAKAISDFTVSLVSEKPNEYTYGHGAHAVRGRIERVLERLNQQAKEKDKFDWTVTLVNRSEVSGTPATMGEASAYMGGFKMKSKY